MTAGIAGIQPADPALDDPALDDPARGDFSVAAPDPDLAAALVDGDVELRFRPGCDADGRTLLVQAVPVWVRGMGGLLPGPDLWGAAGRQGCSAQLQRWLLREACASVAEVADDRLSVAVSLPAGPAVVGGLAPEVAAALVESGLAAARLILALPEATLVTASPVVRELAAIRATGVRLRPVTAIAGGIPGPAAAPPAGALR